MITQMLIFYVYSVLHFLNYILSYTNFITYIYILIFREVLYIISPNSGISLSLSLSKILEYILAILHVTDLAERFTVFMERIHF